MHQTIKVAVTGASGQIGYHVCKNLIASGYHVKALVKSEPDYLKTMPLEFIKGDMLDPDSLFRLVSDTDYVIHLAARVVLRKDKSGLTQKVNIDGVNHLLQASLANGVKRVVHFSSIHAFKPLLHLPVMDEQNPLATDYDILYEFTKATAQFNAIEFSKKHPLEIIILNPTAVIGPEDFKPSNTAKALTDMYLGKLPFLPDGGFDWVDVRDVADAAVKALYNGQSGESYLLAGEYLKWGVIARMVSQLTGKKLPTKTLPLALLKPIGSLMEIYSDITATKPVFTKEAILHLEHAHPNISSAKAEKELGFKSRPLVETIEDTMKWLKATGKIKGEF